MRATIIGIAVCDSTLAVMRLGFSRQAVMVRWLIFGGDQGGWVRYGQWTGHGVQIATSTLLWVVLPLAAGITRTRRREVR